MAKAAEGAPRPRPRAAPAAQPARRRRSATANFSPGAEEKDPRRVAAAHAGHKKRKRAVQLTIRKSERFVAAAIADADAKVKAMEREANGWKRMYREAVERLSATDEVCENLAARCQRLASCVRSAASTPTPRATCGTHAPKETRRERQGERRKRQGAS